LPLTQETARPLHAHAKKKKEENKVREGAKYLGVYSERGRCNGSHTYIHVLKKKQGGRKNKERGKIFIYLPLSEHTP